MTPPARSPWSPARRLVAVLAAGSAVTLAAPATVTLGSCAALSSLGGLGKYAPKVRFDEMKLRSFDWTSIGVDFVFTIDNPHPVGLSLDRFTWGLDLAGKELAKGVQSKGIKLAANGKSPLVLPVDLTFTKIYETVTNLIGKDEVPYTLRGSMGFDTPLGAVDVPVKKEGMMPMLHKPNISLKAARVTSIDVLKGVAGFEVDLGMNNPNAGSTYAFTNLAYGITLGGKKVATGSVAKAKSVGKAGSKTLTLPLNLKLGALGQTLVSALTGKKSLVVGIDADVDVGTALGKIPLSVSKVKTLSLK